MPRAGSEWTTITISKKVYEMIRRAMMESNEKAGYRKYRSISHFAEHAFMNAFVNAYAREFDQAFISHFRFPFVEETADTRALEMVIKYEESEGRKPHDVSNKGRGYDIESVDKKTGEVRYIEVKSGLGDFPIAVTSHEFQVANKLREKYFLYVVTYDHITIIQNPAEVWSKEKNVKAIVSLPNWVEKGKTVRMS